MLFLTYHRLHGSCGIKEKHVLKRYEQHLTLSVVKCYCAPLQTFWYMIEKWRSKQKSDCQLSVVPVSVGVYAEHLWGVWRRWGQRGHVFLLLGLEQGALHCLVVDINTSVADVSVCLEKKTMLVSFCEFCHLQVWNLSKCKSKLKVTAPVKPTNNYKKGK